MKTTCAVLIIIVTLGLSACQGLVSQPASTVTVGPRATSLPVGTILPTLAPHEIPSVFFSPLTIPSQACLMADLAMISEMLWQLESFAWSPTGDALAYVGPSQLPNSPTGSLELVAGPRFDIPQTLAQSAIGDPTWSPDGLQIAFVADRSSDELGTVMVTDADGSALLDLLPGDMARTDPGAGFKAIEGWWDQDHLVIETNCGTGCRQPVSIELATGTMAQVFSYELGAPGVSYTWSPDHRSVVVTNGANPQIGVDLGNEGIIWLSGYRAQDPAWTYFWTFFSDWIPDSSRFIFLRQPDDASDMPQLWVWHRKTRQSTPLLPGVIAARWSPQSDQVAFLVLGQPHFAPDGSWQSVIAAPQGPNLLGVGVMQWPERNIVTFLEINNIDFGYSYLVNARQLLTVVWSPDGQHLVYHDGVEKAGILHLTGNKVVQYDILTQPHLIDEVRWSPDGSKLAIRVSDRLQIFAVPCSP